MSKQGTIVIRRGSVSVKIYRTKDAFTVAWYEGDRRKRRRRVTLKDARDLAEETAARLQQGRAESSQLTGEDRQIYLDLRARAKASGFTLTEAVETLERVRDALGPSINLAQALSFYRAHGQGQVEERTAPEAFEEFITVKEKATSKRNVEGLRLHIGRFLEDFQGPVSGVTYQQIVEHLTARDYSPGYFNNARNELVTFFRWCRKQRYLPEMQTEAEKVEKRTELQEAVSIFKAAQFEEIIHSIREDLRPYLALSAFGGLRPSEVGRLEWDAIDWEEDHIYISATVAQKTLSDRFIPLNETLRAWLEPYRKDSGSVIEWRRPSEMLTRELKRLREAELINLKEWPTDVLRHSYGSYRLARIENKQKLAEEMGNSPQIITSHYRRPVTKKAADEWFAIRPAS